MKEPVPIENSIRVESAESSMLYEIIVLSTMNPRLSSLFLPCSPPVFGPRASLQTEVLALCHQLAVLQVNAPRRLRLQRSDRLLWILLSRFWSGWRACLRIVQPATVIAWHRRAFASIGDGSRNARREDQAWRWRIGI